MTRRNRSGMVSDPSEFRLRPIGAALANIGSDHSSRVAHSALLSAGLLLAGAALSEQTPVPTQLPSTNFTMEYPKTGSPITYTQSVTNGVANGVITQINSTNIVKWESFDIGSKAQLQIIQPDSKSVLFNKIENGNPTQIFGQMSANGRVYVFNPNGIVFGPDSIVNVNTLVASSLKFDENRVIKGLVSPTSNQPVLYGDANSKSIVVQYGAKIATTESGGQIVLAAPDVTNNGSLVAQDGQVILAAGQKVYLAASRSAALRGLLVEVQNDTDQPSAISTVENGLKGTIDVGRGNATMVGYAVNQNGLVSAKTSVNLNGSIYLRARDQAFQRDAGDLPVALRSGNLVLGSNSVTKVELDTSDKSTLTVESQSNINKSEIELIAGNIELKGSSTIGAQVIAPSGKVTLAATRLENYELPTDSRVNPDIIDPAKDAYRVDIGNNVVIDVSGKKDTMLSMESNVIAVELRGTELADNTIVRDSSLYGSKVNIDIRKGTGMANISGWLNQVPVSLGQLNATGGKVSIQADAAIIQRSGSNINVDGGGVDYASGYVNTSQLMLGGKQVDIGNAKANTPYTAVVNVSNSPTNFEQGYYQGASAGSIGMSAPIVVMQGDITGKVSPGDRQRDPLAASAPRGGLLQIGNGSSSVSSNLGFDGNVKFGGTGTTEVPELGETFNIVSSYGEAPRLDLNLNSTSLRAQGFSRIDAVTNGNISIDEVINLAPGGQLRLIAGGTDRYDADGRPILGGDISVNANIVLPSGSVAATASGKLYVADDVKIDVAGRWTNDRAFTSPSLNAYGWPNSPILMNGGSIALLANELTLGTNVAMDVSAGAWMKGNGSLVTGNAGSISLESVFFSGAVNQSYLPLLTLGEGLKLSGYGFTSGGKLKLTGGATWIGEADSLPTDGEEVNLLLSPSFFQQGGFTSYDIGANLNLTVAENTLLMPRANSWVTNSNAGLVASGLMASAATTGTLSLAGASSSRPATGLTLRAMISPEDSYLDEEAGLYYDTSSGRVLVQAGASIKLDPRGSLSIFAGRQITVDGSLSAPGGAINFGIGGEALYRSDRGLWLTSNASVNVSGNNSLVYTNASGVSSGTLLDGGSIRVGLASSNGSGLLVDAARGAMLAMPGFVVMESGATLKADGAAEQKLSFKSNGLTAPTSAIAGSGGSIEIRAREGMLLSGDSLFSAKAGGSKAAGGSLTIAVDTDSLSNAPFVDPKRVLNISTDFTNASVLGQLLPNSALFLPEQGDEEAEKRAWYLSGTDATAGWVAGSGWVSPTSFNSGGFGSVTLKGQDELRFGLSESSFSVVAGNTLILDAPNIAADYSGTSNTVTLTAPYVRIGSGDDRYQTPSTAVGGNANMVVNGGTIDLIGQSAMQGFNDVRLNASADVRLTGVNTASYGQMIGSLSMVGDLAITDAQTYPTTMSDFTFSVNADDLGTGTLSFVSNGNTPGKVLSAGGSVKAYAKTILQSGRLVAPFGSITLGNLDAEVSSIITTGLQFANGSVTSVAGVGLVPFGLISNADIASASDWGYQLSDGTLVSIGAKGNTAAQRALPSKTITSNAGSISVASGATLDLSGGGNLFAYEFTAGKGGSKDILADATTYAINPAFRNGVAPVDSTYNSTASIEPGRSIYLSGAPGLPAGIYTLLPGHYALLPGSFAVTAASDTTDLQASSNTQLPDGTQLVSGRLLASATGGGDTRTSGFYVMPRSVVDKKSSIAVKNADEYLKSKLSAAELPEMPIDGGSVSFNIPTGGGAFNLNGSVNLASSTSGRNGIASFSAPVITVVGSDSSGASGMVLSATKLNSFGADSLLIGGKRTTENGLTTLTDIATTVTVANDASQPLNGAEVMFTAKESLVLNEGSVVQADREMARTPTALAFASNVPNAAIVRVSGTSSPITLTRPDGTTSTNSTITINSGATLAATSNGAAMIDATGRVNISTGATFTAGKSLWLGASAIAIDTKVGGTGTAGSVLLNADRLSKMSSLSWLNLISRSGTIDVYGDALLGNNLMTLNMTSAGIRNKGVGDLTMTANTFSVSGFEASDNSVPAAGSGSGKFLVNTNSLNLGENAFELSGFADYSIKSSGAVTASGTQASLTADRDLTVEAAGFVTTNTASATISSAKQLTLSGNSNSANLEALGYGGQWNFAAGSNLNFSSIVKAPSGKVSMTAVDQLNVNGGLIDGSGITVNFEGTKGYSPGGTITLSGTQVTINAAATLDVSAGGEAGGAIAIQALNSNGASGSYQIDGTLKGSGVGTQGSFSLDAYATNASILSALNAKLNTSGFTESRTFRARTGNIAITSDIIAKETTIAADIGDITVSATIDARGAKGGNIGLYASQSNASGSSGRVILQSGANLLANATGSASDTGAGSAGNGGYVVISASNADGSQPTAVSGGASIDLQSGSVIDVSGRDQSGNIVARGGSVVLRAPRTSDNKDVAINSLKGTINNSTNTRLEAVKTYSATTIKGATEDGDLSAGAGEEAGTMFNDAKSFAQNGSTILSRLQTSSAKVNLSPGMEVRSSGDLTVSVNENSTTLADRGWDFSTWRFNDGSTGNLIPTLTLRAKGNLNIIGSISDGFDKPEDTALAMPNWALSSGASSSFRLVGGADLAAANPLTVLSSNKLEAGKGDVLIDFARKTTDSDVPVSVYDMPVATVRTGSGRIDVATGRDFALGILPLFRTSNSEDITLDGKPDPSIGYPDYEVGYLITQVGATLYTAGKSVISSANQPAPKNVLNTFYGAGDGTPASATFGAGGGAVTVVAGRNVNGPRRGDIQNSADREDSYYRTTGTLATEDDPSTPEDETLPAMLGDKVYVQMALPNLVNSWLFRQGRIKEDGTFEAPSYDGTSLDTLGTAWWARPEYFNQGIATLGGGDINVRAAGNVNDLSVSAATNARMNTSTNILLEQGGGDVTVRAGQSIRGGSLYVQKGSGLLLADGSITSGNLASTPGDATTALNPLIALGDAKVNVIASKNAAIESVYNPMLASQSLVNLNMAAEKDFFTGYFQATSYDLFRSGAYGDFWNPDTSDSSFKNSQAAFAQYSNFSTYGTSSAFGVTAVGGNVQIKNDQNTYLRAGGEDVFINTTEKELFLNFYTYAPQTVALRSLSGDLSSSSSFVLAPNAQGQLSLLAKGSINLATGNGAAIRMLDIDPASMSTVSAPRIMSNNELSVLNGSVSTGISAHMSGGLHATDTTPAKIIALTGDIKGDITTAITIDIPKAVEISAGRDIVDLGMRLQHNGSSDASIIRAGRDVINSAQKTGGQNVTNLLGGAGRLEVAAGRHIDLGTGYGFRTRGSLDNPYFADEGASIVMRAGVDTTSIDYDAFVNTYVKTQFPDRWSSLSLLLANKDYLGLNAAFFKILRDTSKNEAIKPLTTDKSLAEQLVTPFDKAIASLLVPSGLGGDISVFSSQIKTEQGGSIDLFAPFGSIYAGLTVPSDTPANQGIFTIRGGAINSVVYKDFLVNQGRIFTLGGGDIELVSQTSNIDAGRGAKTASSAPPPVLTIDPNGIVQVDVSSSISGSGIATLQTKAGQLPSNVYPIAPRGIFDAGDAGVRSSGSVEVTANVVLNANNISASGSISGSQVPVAAAPAPVAPASSAATQQTKANQTAVPETARKETALNVELLGYGNQDVDPKDSTKPSKSDKSKKKDGNNNDE